MPELPEVETTCRTLKRVMRGKRIVTVVADLDDAIVFDRDKPAAVARALQGARVTGVGRRGKYFWLELSRKPWVVVHLGMTGNVRIRKPPRRGARGEFVKAWGGLKLWSEAAPDSPRAMQGNILSHARLRITLDDGTEIAMTDPRRFGRIRLAQDPLNELPISKLGFDPLLDFPSARQLHTLLNRRRAPIKAVLLDQKVFAGVGNWIADEVLYQSRIAPHRMATKLSLAEVTRLRTKLLAIVRLAVARRADYSQYPHTWLFHHRWGRDASAAVAAGHPIAFDTVGGRTTAWVPELQK